MVGLLLLIGLMVGMWRIQQQNLEKLDRIRQAAQTLSKNQFSDQKDLFTIEKEWAAAQTAIYASLIQTFGSAFFVVTAYLSWRTVKASEQKQVTERFSKAIEQLDSDKPTTKLGGIYALERIAIDSYSDHWTIMEVLSYLVRDNSPKHSPDNNPPVTTTIQAALTVIGRRDSTQDPEGKKLDLSDTNLTRANLRSGYFRGAILEDSDLREANLEGADLREVYFGEADLSQANLTNAKLDRINKTNDRAVGRVNLSGAFLCKAKLREAKLREANLQRSDLTKANLHSAYLYGANLSGAVLVEADLSRVDLSHANLSTANLDQANLENADFYQSNVDRANFARAKGLTPFQIRRAQHWQTATYSPQLRQALGLPPEP